MIRIVKLLLIAIFLLWSAVYLFTLSAIPVVSKKARVSYIRTWSKVLLWILQIKLIIRGQIPDDITIIVSNHISWHDILVIGSITRTTFLSKAEVANWPLIGYLARAACTLFIKRGKGNFATVKRDISRSLNNGFSVVVFPEGTTTDGSYVKKFFPNIFQLSSELRLKVIPISLRYTSQGENANEKIAFAVKELTFIQHLWDTITLKNICAHVTIGQPIACEKDPKLYAVKTRDRVLSLLEESKTK